MNFGVEAHALRDLGRRDDADTTIHEAARGQGVVLVSKDSDFVELVTRFGSPPQLLWVTCGNVSNRNLRRVFSTAFKSSLALLEAGEPIVEIGMVP